MGLPDAARIVISAALIAPLAFFMGMPFPLGLARVEATRCPARSLGLGINGCASVTGAVLATLLAIHVGFTAVVVLRWCCMRLRRRPGLDASETRRRAVALRRKRGQSQASFVRVNPSYLFSG